MIYLSQYFSLNTIGYEYYVYGKLCKNVEHTDKTTTLSFQDCARHCDEIGQMFAVDSKCIESRRSDCECMCVIMPRSDNGAVTCETEENLDWQLYRYLDGKYRTIDHIKAIVMTFLICI